MACSTIRRIGMGCKRLGRIVSGFIGMGRICLSNHADHFAPLSEATTKFGRRVRARRTELGLSQEALADIAQLHWTFVGQVERGRRNLTSATSLSWLPLSK